MSATRTTAGRPLSVLVLLLVAVCAGCSSTPDIDLGEPLDASRRLLEMGRYEDASDIAGPIARSTDEDPRDRAEAAFVAGEADFERGEHLAAFRHYRYILENAPWSPHAALIRERLFEIGLAFFNEERYRGWGWFDSRARGVEVLETLQAYFKRSDEADDALRLVGDYFVEEEEFEEAALAYERLFEEYPDSEWGELALWRAGWSRMQLSRGPEYDRDDLLRAKGRLEESLRLFPKGVSSAEARRDLDHVRSQLARSEVIVADFYRGRGVAAGERLRLANAWLLYPDTEPGQLAGQRLEAMGLDLQALRNDPMLSSVDAVRPGRDLWGERPE